jgi:arthrofactin-type cyclic lipopeptide synthetase C
MAEEASAPFDLERGPLIRGRLIHLGLGEHVLLITLHHIVSDGWSLGVLTQELSALYGVYTRGDADPLTPLAIQHADYAVWQRRWLSGEVLSEQSGPMRPRFWSFRATASVRRGRISPGAWLAWSWTRC